MHGGAQCRHNRNYWEFGDYLGIGAGAHGKLTHDGRVTRTARQRSPVRYMAAATPAERIAEEHVICFQELPFEFCLNALRLVDGFDIGTFSAYGATPVRHRVRLRGCARAGLTGRRASLGCPRRSDAAF